MRLGRCSSGMSRSAERMQRYSPTIADIEMQIICIIKLENVTSTPEYTQPIRACRKCRVHVKSRQSFARCTTTQRNTATHRELRAFDMTTSVLSRLLRFWLAGLRRWFIVGDVDDN